MKQIFSRNKFLMLAAVLGMAIAPTKVMAHQVQTNYIINSQSGNSLQLRTTFSNGQPLKGAKVTVTSPNQPYRIRTVGKTDSQGRFTFVPDQSVSGDWEVNIKREGHQDILTVPVTEEGIDLDLMAQNGLEQVGNSDVHYASSPWAIVGGLAIAAAGLGLAKVSEKKQAK